VLPPREGFSPDAVARYADPDTPGALEHAIATLANDPAACGALAAAGHARARSFEVPAAGALLTALRARILAA